MLPVLIGAEGSNWTITAEASSLLPVIQHLAAVSFLAIARLGHDDYGQGRGFKLT